MIIQLILQSVLQNSENNRQRDDSSKLLLITSFQEFVVNNLRDYFMIFVGSKTNFRVHIFFLQFKTIIFFWGEGG